MLAHPRITHLLELAEQGPAQRARLAEDVAELLTHWPHDAPAAMRPTCEALLASAAREVDAHTRTRLRVRLYADPALAARVLPREARDAPLVECARSGESVAARLAETLALSPARAAEIMSDPSGRSLAAACKSLGVSRATFSALALLCADDMSAGSEILSAYDDVPAVEAARALRQWRSSQMDAHAAE